MGLDMKWVFKMPVEIRFGMGTIAHLTSAVKALGKRPALVTDRGLAGLDFIRRITEQLRQVVFFTEVDPNPTVANVDALTARLRAERVDCVVAAGGGSVMDCAKAACSLVKTDEPSVRAFHTGGKNFGMERIPLIAVPTTAGTGSEVTPFAVLDDTQQGVKGPVAANAFYPELAIVDPALTFSLPKKITAATGLDALSHAMEGFWSKNHQPLCDSMAMESGRLIFKHLPAVYENPADEAGRSAMSYAALLAGMAFQLPKNAMVHACSFPLSNRFHMPHGTACAFTLEFALKLNTPATDGRMEAFVAHCGFEGVDAMANAIRTLKRDAGLPCTLAEAGIPIDAVEMLIQESFHPLMNNNPVQVTEADLHRMYRELAG